jgi:hypothetical protein
MQSLFWRQKARAAPRAISGWELDKKGERGVRMSLHDCGMVDVGVVVDGAAVVEQKGIGDMGPKAPIGRHAITCQTSSGISPRLRAPG